ncbi:MAG: class II aldolase/adducin family protein [Armatimonadota bacterium]
MTDASVLAELVRMSLNLAKPENEYVILGEGNTSAKVDENSFFVKQTGAYLSESHPEIFVEIRTKDVLDMFECGELSDVEIKDRLGAARVNPNAPRPSIETLFHAYLLSLPNVNFVGHTHPIAVNTILCSNAAEDIIKSRIFPDEIVYCGIKPVFMPYVDPGVTLAKAVQKVVVKFMDEEGVVPKVVLMQNHGFIALGATAKEVEAITAMYVKTARVLAGAHALGGVHYLSDSNIDRIYTRPDEAYRKQNLH